MTSYVPLLILGTVALGFGVVTLVLSYLLGRPRSNPNKSSTYECGMPPIGSARERFGVKFYTIALLFIVFDVEAVFVYPWAVLLKDLGWSGYVAMAFFAFTLVIALAYVWKKGALELETE